MNILILVKLLVAHAVGDFFLQTDGICEGKKAKGSERMMYLGLHSLINAALAYILVADWVCWMIPVVIFISHFVIDQVKTSLDSEHVGIFIVDQLAHIAVLVGIWAWMTDTDVTLTVKWAVDYRVWLVVLCYLGIPAMMRSRHQVSRICLMTCISVKSIWPMKFMSSMLVVMLVKVPSARLPMLKDRATDLYK